MAISQESLLGMLIPDIYIDGITLESSGTPAIEDNPHILHDREAQSIKDFNDAMDNRTLRVTVDMCLKERLDNTLIGSWFKEQEFHKYLKLWVIMTTDEGSINLFSESQNMINFATEGVAAQGGLEAGIGGSGAFSQDEVDLLLEHVGGLDRFVDLQQSGALQDAKLSVSADVTGDNSDLTQMSSSIDENGVSIHDFTYRTVFELKELEPRNLAVFAVSYLDLGAMKADYDLEFNVGTLEQQNGKVVSEIVIKRGSTVSSSNVWVDGSGNYWTGPVHKTGANSWATGSAPSASSQKLTKRTVPNDILQDFRDIAEIMKYSLDADIKTVMGDFDKNKFCGKDRPFMDHKYLYFSDIWLSRDTNGTARFMFAFDKKEYLAKNSAFGYLLERLDSGTRNSILDAASVRKMTVLRRRVKSVDSLNKLGSPYTGEILFDKAEPYDNIVLSADTGDNQLTERNTPSGSIRQADLLTSSPTSEYGIQYYTGQDKEMSSRTAGIYQYGVRVEIEDGIQEYLRDFTSTLLEQRELLNLYLEHSMKLGMTKFLQEVVDPHLDHGAERQASVLENSGHYDPLKNRFTERFSIFMEEQYSSSQSPFYQSHPWVRAALAYVQAIFIISQEAEMAVVENNLNIAEKISMFMAPTTGTPKGIMAVINLFDILISKFQKLTGDDYRSRGRASMTPHPSNPSGSSVTSGENIPGVILKCENWFFNNVFDSRAGRSTGIDYLTNMQANNPSGSPAGMGTSAPNTQQIMQMAEYADIVFGNSQVRGLKMVDGGYWSQRVQVETTKFYRDENASTGITLNNETLSSGGTLADSSYGFLSPSSFIANNSAFSMQTNEDADYYITAEAALVSANENLYPTIPNSSSGTNQTASQKAYQSSMEKAWAGYNLTITPATQTPPVPLHQTEVSEDAELTQCETQQLQAVDPFPAWSMDSDGNIVAIGNQQNEDPIGAANADFSDFFAKMAPSLIAGETLPGDMSSSTDQATSSTTALSMTEKGNAFSVMKGDQSLASAVATSNGMAESDSVSTSEAYDSSPNQVKQLLIAQVNPGLVNLTAQADSWAEAPKFTMNYQFLAMVERFDGFETTTPAYQDDSVRVAAMPSIKRPRWVTLTEDYFKQAEGQEILCRLSEYNCEQLGITRPEGIEAPTYDAYFILTPFRRSPPNVANETIIIIEQQVTQRYEKSSYGARQYGTTNQIKY